MVIFNDVYLVPGMDIALTHFVQPEYSHHSMPVKFIDILMLSNVTPTIQGVCDTIDCTDAYAC